MSAPKNGRVSDSKHANRRTDEQLVLDRVEIARLYIKRMSHKEMAVELNKGRAEDQHISPRMVGYELRGLRRQWKHESMEFVQQAHTEMLMELQEIEREAWSMWQRSKGTIKTRRGRYVTDADGVGVVKPTTVEEVELIGEPRYLQVLLGVSQRKAALLGIAQRIELESYGVNIDLTTLSREQLKRIADGENPQFVVGMVRAIASVASGDGEA